MMILWSSSWKKVERLLDGTSFDLMMRNRSSNEGNESIVGVVFNSIKRLCFQFL